MIKVVVAAVTHITVFLLLVEKAPGTLRKAEQFMPLNNCIVCACFSFPSKSFWNTLISNVTRRLLGTRICEPNTY